MRSSSYLSTSQTAQMLGLSIGTVQRMVESGTLQAYTTQGGHRRILASSVRNYCQIHGVPSIQLPTATPGVFIIHHSSMAPQLSEALRALPRVHLINHPLELAGIAEDAPVFFVDAHVTWLDWHDVHRPQGLAPGARFIIYNTADLSSEQQQSLSFHAQLYPGDISTELMAGFLLGLGRQESIPASRTSSH